MHQPGETIDGRYELIRGLGRGGMGEVWSAADLKLGRSVAIKLLFMPQEADHASRAVKRLGAEARALALVGHEHAVTVYDWGGAGGDFYITMELLDGHTLQALLDRARRERADGKPLDAALPELDKVVEWADRICEVLETAHASGIVHRDIKPSNVMVTQRGAVRVLDFGIAKLLEESGQTRPGTVLGTPAYMAPEQERGSAGRRSDLYSLGCLLYALVTGWPPARGEGVVAPAPGSLRPGLPAGLDRLILRLLKEDPAARPQTAGEVRRLLGTALMRQPDAPAPVLPGPPVLEPVIWYDREPEPTDPYDPEGEPVADKESEWWDALYPPEPDPEPEPKPRPAAPRPQPAAPTRLYSAADGLVPVPRARPARPMAPKPGARVRERAREREREARRQQARVKRREIAETIGTVLLTWAGTTGLVFTTTDLSFVLSALCGVSAAGLAYGAELVVRRFQIYPRRFRTGRFRTAGVEDGVVVASLAVFLIVLGGCIWLMASQTDQPWWADALSGAGEAVGMAIGAGSASAFLLDDGWKNVGQVLINGILLGAIAFGLFFAALDMAWWTAMISALAVWAAGSFLSAILDLIAEDIGA
ncbi:serine/threonine-protein kinase [Streptomyces sp. WAC05374]|uniref:serine/threonine-protein kinase n=1 Tax=Streptomyces sp. WAC05374 TaxID=2487420 RepID=UPI00135C5A02|nr:serine/threonine-protein kinase [Streptomyces sp. WAC05374]